MPDLGQQLWTKPVFPHSYDEEFENDFNINDWDIRDVSAGLIVPKLGEVNAYDTSLTGDSVNINVNKKNRQSWMLIQPGSTTDLSITKKITFQTNFLVISRIKFNYRYGVISNNDCTIGIVVAKDDSGFDSGNMMKCLANEPDAGIVQAIIDLFKYYKQRVNLEHYKLILTEDAPLEETLTEDTIDELETI